MATYVLPQVLVFQEFQVVPAAAAHPLRAHIMGGHAKLVRFSESDEQAEGFLGYYDSLLDTDYDWPNRPAGGQIDPDYTKVWMKDALLQYFQTSVGGGHDITKQANYSNRIGSGDLNFAENGDDYPRDDLFIDRDVKVGDVVKIRGVDSEDEVRTVWSYVKRLIGDPVAAVVNAAEGDDANADTQVQSESVEKISGVENGIVVTADGAAYDGLADGYITETYDVLVIEGSISQDDTKARLRIISGSGTDDQASVTPAARGVAFDIGTRGAQITITDDDLSASSQSAEDAGIPVDELVVGHKWRVTVNQAFTKPTATSGGTYTGDSDTTYVVEVTRGGTYAGTPKPQISVTTTNGVDISGPTNVTAAATAVAVGTEGTTISFNQTALRKGDRYYVTVEAEAEGPIRQIELGTNLPDEVTSGTELDLWLFIRKPTLQIEENRTGAAPLVNWEQSETQITVKSGITAFDSSWTEDGVPVALDVVSEDSQEYGGVYVEYRAWLSTLCNEINGIADVGDINDQISGKLHPDNPLKWGVFKALENSNGTEVKYTSVCNPNDDEDWADALGLLVGRDDVYGLVPLTRRRTVLDLFAAHVDDQSGPEQALWRNAWFSLAGVPEIPVVHAGSDVANHVAATTSDEEVCLCTISDDPLTSGTQYTILKCPAGNGKFITNGVRAGDIVRTQYTGDGFGNFTYSEYVVDEVSSEDEIRLLTGPPAAISVAAKTEVWRNLTATEEAAEIVLSAGSWGDRRIKAVWPDTIESSGTVQEGYHLCAALAGLVSGVLPHQGLTHLEVTGFSNVARTNEKFNRTQLDTMAVGGVWIVTQDPNSGLIFSRHALTTASYDDINQREEMITRNVDSISFRFKEHFAPFIGVTNVTPVIITRIGTEVENLKSLLKAEAFTENLGGQLIDAEVLELRRHLTLKDRIVLKLSLEVPYALNNLEVHLSI
jgi:hypothetical protein